MFRLCFFSFCQKMVPFWNFRGLNNQLNDEMFKGKFNDDHYRRFESYEEIPENEKS